MAAKHEVTMEWIQERAKQGVSTWSKKDNSPRGCTTVFTSELKVGDKVAIGNYFTEIVE